MTRGIESGNRQFLIGVMELNPGTDCRIRNFRIRTSVHQIMINSLTPIPFNLLRLLPVLPIVDIAPMTPQEIHEPL